MHDYIHWLMAIDAHHDRVTPKVHKFIDQMKGWYMAFDTERKWVVPFSLIGMLVLTIALIPVVIVVAGYGWLLVLIIKYDKQSHFLYKVGYRICRWLKAFVSCAIMCLLVHILFIALGLEVALETFMGQ